jgi:hypothetical protein
MGYLATGAGLTALAAAAGTALAPAGTAAVGHEH